MPSSTARTLYVIRHGEAANARLDGADFDRPLTSRGHADVRRLWALVAEVPPVHIWCSPARRTIETGEGLIGGAPSGAAPVPTLDERIYSANAAELLRVLADSPADAAAVALIGHNPAVSDLVHKLAEDARGPSSFVPGALVVLRTTRRWNELARRTAALIGVDSP